MLTLDIEPQHAYTQAYLACCNMTVTDLFIFWNIHFIRFVLVQELDMATTPALYPLLSPLPQLHLLLQVIMFWYLSWSDQSVDMLNDNYAS